MLDMIDVSKSYRGVAAVRMLSLSARPGQVVGLLGPNGSGKSTTVKMLIGLLRPSRGQIRWQGEDIQPQLLDYQRLVGYVPEEPRLYAYLKAPEYLELVGGLHGIEHRTLRQRINRYLELFGLDHDTEAPMSAFSKGMRQKVLLSAALLHDPEIVILDEPSSGLDVAFTLILRRLVILHKGNVVAHDSVTRLREIVHVASLEDVFAALAVDQDVDRIGTELATVAAE